MRSRAILEASQTQSKSLLLPGMAPSGRHPNYQLKTCASMKSQSAEHTKRAS